MEKQKNEKRKFWFCVYGVGNIGYELMYEFFKNFQNFFLTDICGFSTLITGSLLTSVNIAKAIFTPISGIVIDADPFKRKDKHTPWILIMPVLLGSLFIMMAYLAMQGKIGNAILVIFAIFYFLPVLLQNGYRSAIPSMALNAQEASFLSGSINVGSNIGRTLTGVIVPIIMVKLSADGKTEDAQGFFWAVVISVILTIIVYWVSVLGIKMTIRADALRDAGKEAKEAVKKQGTSFFKMIAMIFTDKNILIPFACGLGIFFRTFVVSPTAPYFFKYVAGDMLQYATFSTATNIAGIASCFVAPFIVSKICPDTKKVCIISVLSCIVCHLLLFVSGSSTIGFIVLMTFAQFFYQGTSVLLFGMFVNAVDASELRARKRGEKKVASGTAMSLHFTAVMCAQVLGGMIRNVALAQAGYAGAETVASDTLTSGLINMYAIWPTLFLVIGLVALFFYTLDAKTMKAIHEELDPMREAAAKEAQK